jgi:hypothetical protein
VRLLHAGLFPKKKPHFTEAGWDTVIVEPV